MKYGPLVFLAAFFALAASWCGFVLAPQIQIGRQQQETNMYNPSDLYPLPRPGLARQGLAVYRANGCAACHSQQVGQTGTVADVILTDAGTNPVAVADALVKANVGVSNANPAGLSGGLPKPIVRGVEIEVANATVSALLSAGAKAGVELVPLGPDIARGWGKRRTVAEDYLADDTVMPGSLRVGPDLANVGVRRPDLRWHLRHLYAPTAEVKDSAMPPYRFLFEKKKIELQPSPDALQLPKEFAPPPGYEIVPKPAARALAAYLASLRTDTPLFEAPTAAPPLPPAAATNAPAGPAPAATNPPAIK